MTNYRRLPGGKAPAFQQLQSRLERAPALTQRLNRTRASSSSATVRLFRQLNEGRSVGRLGDTIATNQQLLALLHEHPMLKGKDRSTFVLDWLNADVDPNTLRGVYQQSAVEFL